MTRHPEPTPVGFTSHSGSALPFLLPAKRREQLRADDSAKRSQNLTWNELWERESLGSQSLEEEVVSAGLLTGTELAETYSHHFLVPLFDPNPDLPLPIDPTVASLLPQQFCAEYQMVPLADDGTTIDVAIVTPDSLTLRDEVLRLSGRSMRPLFATKEVVERAFTEIYPASVDSDFIESSHSAVAASMSKRQSCVPCVARAGVARAVDQETVSLETEESSDGSSYFQRLARELLAFAVRRRATEAAIETFGGDYQIRVRVDGRLCAWQPEATADQTWSDEVDMPNGNLGQGLILSLLHLAGTLDHALGQDRDHHPASAATAFSAPTKANQALALSELNGIIDANGGMHGSVRIRHGRRRLVVDIETVRTVAGFKAMLRFYGRQSVPQKLEDLGLLPEQYAWTTGCLQMGPGLFIVFGPPHAGKRSTLRTMMDFLNEPQRTLVAVEEYVRLVQPGISQFSTATACGLDREQLIRRVLRQEPDVLMVDRIDSRDVAAACLDAVRQGVFVLASLDAPDWDAALVRLRHLGVAREGRRNVVSGLLGQRLVPRLCRACRLLERGGDDHLVAAKWRMRGCELCRFDGYRGRIAIFDHQPQWFTTGNLLSAGPSATYWDAAKKRHREGLIDWATLQESFLSQLENHS